MPCVHIFTPTNVMSAAIIDCHDLRNCLQALLKCISRKVAKSFLATWHFLLVAVREKSATCIFSLFCREDLSFLVGGLLRSSSSIKTTSSIILGSVLPFKQGFLAGDLVKDLFLALALDLKLVAKVCCCFCTVNSFALVQFSFTPSEKRERERWKQIMERVCSCEISVFVDISCESPLANGGL